MTDVNYSEIIKRVIDSALSKINKMFGNQRGIIQFAPVLVLVAVFGIITFLFVSSNAPLRDSIFGRLYQKDASQADVTGSACENTAVNTGCLFLSPVSVNATENNNFQVEVRTNANGDPLNAVEANINFPIDKLQYVSTDFTNSAYSIDAGVVTGSGTVSIVRGSTTNVTGEGLVATITFQPIVASGTASIDIDPSSQVVSATSSTNIMQASSGTNVTIGSTQTTSTAELSAVTSATNIQVGDTFTVNVKTKSETDEINTIDAKIQFDSTKLEVMSTDKTGSVINQFVEDFHDNNTGEISVLGGITAPGIKTSGQDAQVIGIVFRAKAAGSALVDILSSSGVLRNSDNQDILGARNNLTLSIQPGASASPSPSASASPSPTSSPTVSCTLTNAVWNITQNPVIEGSLINLRVTGSTGCDGQQVSFEVREDDSVAGVGGFDNVVNNPGAGTFNGTLAQTNWVAEFQDDGIAGINNPPEFYYVASVVGGTSSINSSDPKLLVNKAGPTFVKGDGNRDGVIDRTDLSVMMSNWGKNSGMPAEIDMNDDSDINVFDFSALVLIFRQLGIIR